MKRKRSADDFGDRPPKRARLLDFISSSGSTESETPNALFLAAARPPFPSPGLDSPPPSSSAETRSPLRSEPTFPHIIPISPSSSPQLILRYLLSHFSDSLHSNSHFGSSRSSPHPAVLSRTLAHNILTIALTPTRAPPPITSLLQTLPLLRQRALLSFRDFIQNLVLEINLRRQREHQLRHPAADCCDFFEDRCFFVLWQFENICRQKEMGFVREYVVTGRIGGGTETESSSNHLLFDRIGALVRFVRSGREVEGEVQVQAEGEEEGGDFLRSFVSIWDGNGSREREFVALLKKMMWSGGDGAELVRLSEKRREEIRWFVQRMIRFGRFENLLRFVIVPPPSPSPSLPAKNGWYALRQFYAFRRLDQWNAFHLAVARDLVDLRFGTTSPPNGTLNRALDVLFSEIPKVLFDSGQWSVFFLFCRFLWEQEGIRRVVSSVLRAKLLAAVVGKEQSVATSLLAAMCYLHWSNKNFASTIAANSLTRQFFALMKQSLQMKTDPSTFKLLLDIVLELLPVTRSFQVGAYKKAAMQLVMQSRDRVLPQSFMESLKTRESEIYDSSATTTPTGGSGSLFQPVVDTASVAPERREEVLPMLEDPALLRLKKIDRSLTEIRDQRGNIQRILHILQNHDSDLAKIPLSIPRCDLVVRSVRILSVWCSFVDPTLFGSVQATATVTSQCRDLFVRRFVHPAAGVDFRAMYSKILSLLKCNQHVISISFFLNSLLLNGSSGLVGLVTRVFGVLLSSLVGDLRKVLRVGVILLSNLTDVARIPLSIASVLKFCSDRFNFGRPSKDQIVFSSVVSSVQLGLRDCLRFLLLLKDESDTFEEFVRLTLRNFGFVAFSSDLADEKLGSLVVDYLVVLAQSETLSLNHVSRLRTVLLEYWLGSRPQLFQIDVMSVLSASLISKFPTRHCRELFFGELNCLLRYGLFCCVEPKAFVDFVTGPLEEFVPFSPSLLCFVGLMRKFLPEPSIFFSRPVFLSLVLSEDAICPEIPRHFVTLSSAFRNLIHESFFSKRPCIPPNLQRLNDQFVSPHPELSAAAFVGLVGKKLQDSSSSDAGVALEIAVRSFAASFVRNELLIRELFSCLVDLHLSLLDRAQVLSPQTSSFLQRTLATMLFSNPDLLLSPMFRVPLEEPSLTPLSQDLESTKRQTLLRTVLLVLLLVRFSTDEFLVREIVRHDHRREVFQNLFGLLRNAYLENRESGRTDLTTPLEMVVRTMVTVTYESFTERFFRLHGVRELLSSL